MLRKGNERKKWEMEMEHTVPVTRSSIIYFLKIKKKKYIYIYIYIYTKFIPILIITGIKSLF